PVVPTACECAALHHERRFRAHARVRDFKPVVPTACECSRRTPTPREGGESDAGDERSPRTSGWSTSLRLMRTGTAQDRHEVKSPSLSSLFARSRSDYRYALPALKKRRVERNHSLRGLASEVGCSDTLLIKVERGSLRASPSLQDVLVVKLGAERDELF